MKYCRYIAKVDEVVYLDNWKNGMIGDTTIQEVDSKIVDSVAEAVKWFKDKYERPDVQPLELLDGEHKITAVAPMAKFDGERLTDASCADIDAWKAGETDLYSREHQLTVQLITDVLEEALSHAMKEAGCC